MSTVHYFKKQVLLFFTNCVPENLQLRWDKTWLKHITNYN